MNDNFLKLMAKMTKLAKIDERSSKSLGFLVEREALAHF